MKKLLTAAASVLLLTQGAMAEAGKTVKIGGSSVCESTLLQGAKLEAIKKILGDKITIDVSSSSSGGGLQNLVDGTVDISLNSGGEAVYKKVEKASKDDYPLSTLAKGKIVFIVHPNNPVKVLTVEQIKGIFSKSANWKDFGEGDTKGKDQKIVSVSEKEEGGIFNHLKFKKSESSDALMMASGGKIINAVAADETAIGYTFVMEGSKSDDLKDVKIIKVESADDFKLDLELTAITKGKPSGDAEKVIEAIKKSAEAK